MQVQTKDMEQLKESRLEENKQLKEDQELNKYLIDQQKINIQKQIEVCDSFNDRVSVLEKTLTFERANKNVIDTEVIT